MTITLQLTDAEAVAALTAMAHRQGFITSRARPEDHHERQQLTSARVKLAAAIGRNAPPLEDRSA